MESVQQRKKRKKERKSKQMVSIRKEDGSR
jgi:hypothetical protein